ncbi:MAG: thiol:disulfide interchange protein DsbA/DsbL [Candidatus Accumulibacter sp.]|jgi:thiol:disulfide interchange protein DsbA|nr:thiol:disulfide interchange protein DsbA/DsbL [Accumulibacter sp.]
MQTCFSQWIAVFLLAFAGVLPSAHARDSLTAGEDYRVIAPPVSTDTPEKIEVIEFFSYACPHCSELNPLVTSWASRLPSGVVLKRVPVSFNNPFYTIMARFYYALEAIGEEGRLNAAIFDAIHNKNLRLVDEKSITEWVASKNVDPKKFSDAFNAFGVDSRVKRAEQLRRDAKINGVPAFVVDGRYQVMSSASINGYGDFLKLTDKIIEKRAIERRKK